MNVCITIAFLTGHDAKTTKKTRMPSQGNFLAFHADQPHIAHNEGISDGFTSPTIAHPAPAVMNPLRVNAGPDAAAKAAAIARAENEVSHIQTGAISMGGATAEINPARFAVRAPNQLRAAIITITTVSREKIS